MRYEDIELTEEERETALAAARRIKHNRLESDRMKALAAKTKADVLRPWNPEEQWQHAWARGTQMLRTRANDPSLIFEATEEQVPIIKALALYLTKSPEFEQLDRSLYNSTNLNFSLNKGLWIWGNPGVGKTMLMQMFASNKRRCYRLLQCPKIVSSFVKDGYDAIRQYSKEWKEPPGASNYYQDKVGICYNDLGTEPMQALSHGNRVNVMEHLFLETYENAVPFCDRHVTTNLTFDQVRECYGERVLDRIKECFNILELRGKSLRK